MSAFGVQLAQQRELPHKIDCRLSAYVGRANHAALNSLMDRRQIGAGRLVAASRPM